VLENRPSLEDAKTYIRRLRACTRRPHGAGRVGREIDPGVR
jgi:hypothetical protein